MDDDIPHWEQTPASKDTDEQWEWRNKHNGTLLAIIPTDDKPEIEDDWMVTGENSTLDTFNELEKAKELANDYMQDIRRPSPML